MRSSIKILFVFFACLLFYRYSYAQPRAIITAQGVVRNANDTIYVCQGNRIQYTGTASDNAITHNWSFGGGVPSNSILATPTPLSGILYNTPGTYVTKLIVTSNTDVPDSVSVYVTVSNTSPVAGFNFTQPVQCANIPDTFTSSSAGVALSYSWNFGDASTSTEQNPVHQFTHAIGPPGPRSYTVSLTVTDYYGCSDNTTSPVTVRNMPDATISSNDPTVQLTFFNGDSTFKKCQRIPFYNFAFNNLSATNSTNVSDTLDWGDLNPDSVFKWDAQVVQHTYPFGVTSLTRYITAIDGCTGTRKYNIFLGSSPSVNIEAPITNIICAGDSIVFPIRPPLNPNPAGTVYTVNFHDNTPILTFIDTIPSTLTHAYTHSSCFSTETLGQPNSFYLEINANNPCGPANAYYDPIYVSDKPIARFSVTPHDTTCVGSIVTLTNITPSNYVNTAQLPVTCQKLKAAWTISPPEYSIISGSLTSQTLQVQFNRDTTFTIIMAASGEIACSNDADTQKICINPIPTRSFTLSDNMRHCIPDTVTAFGTTNTATCGKNTFNWSVEYHADDNCTPSTRGDTLINGTTLNSVEPQFVFRTPGIYKIILQTIAPGAKQTCKSDTLSKTVIVKGYPNIMINTDTVLCVNGSVQPTITNQCNTAGSSAQWTFTGTTISSFNGFNPPVLDYTSAGLFKIVAAVTNSCGSTLDSLPVSVIAPIAPDAGPDTAMCSGNTISIGQAAAVTGVTYEWTPATGISKPDTTVTDVTLFYRGGINDTTMYQFILTASVGTDASCKLSDTVSITVKRSPDLQFTNTPSPLCSASGTRDTIVVTGAVSYTWLPMPDSLNTTGDTAWVFPAVTTNYTVIGSLLNACTDTNSIPVSVGVKPILGNDTAIKLCRGIPLDLYDIYDSTGLESAWTLNGNSITDPSAILAPGNYQLIAADRTTGCADTLLVSFDTLPKPDFGADRNESVCSGGTLNLDTIFSTAGLTPRWSFNNTPVGNSGSVSIPGTYTLIVTNIAGCSDTVNITLSTIPKPSLGDNRDTAVCAGNTVNLNNIYNTSGYSSALWTFSGVTVTDPANTTAKGEYQLIVGSNGCSDTALFTLDTLAKPRLGDDDSAILCTTAGNYINLNSFFNIANASVTWTVNGAPVTNPDSINTSGLYQLAAFINSCSDTATIKVTAVPQPDLITDSTLVSICSGTATNLTVYYNPVGFDINWTYNGSGVPDSTEIYEAGIYTIIASSPGGGCRDTARVIVTVNPKPETGPSIDTFICPGQKVNLNNVYDLAGLTVLWSLNGIQITTPGAVTDSGYYYGEVENIDGCKDTAIVHVIFNPKPNVGKDTTYNGGCLGYPVDLTPFFNTTGLTALWTHLQDTIDTPTRVFVPGVYQLVVTNGQGCMDTAFVTLNFFPKPNLGNDSVVYAPCKGDTVDITGIYAAPGLLSVWIFNSAAIPPPVAVTEFGVYELIAQDPISGCRDTAVASVLFYDKPVLWSNTQITPCSGSVLGALDLPAQPDGITVSWYRNGILLPNPGSVVLTASTIYQAVASNHGCTDTAYLVVDTLRPRPDIKNDSITKCFPYVLNLDSLYPGNYKTSQWITLSGTPFNPVFETDSSGIYQLTVSNTADCYDTATVTFVLKPPVFADAGRDTIAATGLSFQLKGSGGISYLWQPGRPLLDNDTIATPAATLVNDTRFILTVMDGFTEPVCFDKDTIDIKVYNGPEIYVPNAFTPDGNSLNDIFKPVYAGIKSLEYFKIYNRWGNLVFQTSDLTAGWDGRYKGKPQAVANYVWVLLAYDINGRRIPKKGNVLLIR